MKYRSVKCLLTVSAFALSTASVGHAADAQKVSEALAAAFSGYGLTLKTSSVEASGENIVLKGVSFAPTQGGGEASPPIDVTLESVTEDDAAYTVGLIAAPAGSYPVKDGTWEFGGANMKGLRISKPGSTDAMSGSMLYETMEVLPSKFVGAGGVGEFVSTNGMKSTMSPYTAGQALDMTMTGDFAVNVGAIAKDDANAMGMISALGLNQMAGTINVKGGWNPTDGKLEISEESFDIANVGKLDFKLSLSGYTADFVRATQQLIKDSGGKTDGENGMKMMGLMQQLTFNSMSLRFDDAGITSKALDLAAAQTGQPRDALVMQAKGMAPMMVMQLQDGDLTAAVSTAVSSYLDNPKNLEIKLAPPAPVPFSVLTATGMSAPQALVKQLGLSITANQ
jgi:hypothetical protein